MLPRLSDMGGRFGTLAVGLALTAVACAQAGAETQSSTTSTSTSSTTTTSSTSTTTTTTTTVPQPLVLGFAGDTSFTHGLSGSDPLAGVAGLLAEPDFTIVNLETTVAEAGVGRPMDKRFVFRSPPASVDLLTEAGIDGVSLANNHSLDYGKKALDRTLELLGEGDLLVAGAASDPEAAWDPHFVELAERTVAVLGFTRLPCSWSTADPAARPGVAWACEPFLDSTHSAVEAADHEADLVVVLVHWGRELAACPDEDQRQLARQWAEAGADLIVGSHPHVLQGVEKIGDTWVVYSTGNFAFPSAREASARTAFFRFEIGEKSRLRVTPLRADWGTPYPPSERESETILGLLSDRSFGFRFDEKGRVRAARADGICGA